MKEISKQIGNDKLTFMLLNIFAPKCLATVRPRYRPWSDRPKTDGSEGSVYKTTTMCHESRLNLTCIFEYFRCRQSSYGVNNKEK